VFLQVDIIRHSASAIIAARGNKKIVRDRPQKWQVCKAGPFIKTRAAGEAAIDWHARSPQSKGAKARHARKAHKARKERDQNRCASMMMSNG
jgi:hypothetical protein